MERGLRVKIGELAAAAGISIDSVRFYEKQGLLHTPARGDNNYRRYDAAAVQRLRFIGNCRALDMSLEEVRTLLALLDDPAADHAQVDAVIAEHLRHVRARMKELRALEQQLKQLQAACAQAAPHQGCELMQRLSEGPIAPPRRGVHSGR